MLRAFQWDLARQVERLDHLLSLLPRYAAWGYHELYLHLEDAVDYPSLPGVARADAYTWSDFEKLVRAATRAGIKVVPIVNLLGHTQYLIKTPEWRDLNELRAPDGSPLPAGQICPLHPRIQEVATKLLRDVAPLCTAGKVHVGLDESFSLGRHPLSRAEIARIGLAAHFAAHVTRLHTLAARHSLTLGIWADMLALLPDAIPLLPAHAGLAAYDWYYYPFPRTPRLELRNFADYDLAPALAARGIDYWACPMNGAFRYEPAPIYAERLANITSWWHRARRTPAAGFLVTSWEAYRLALETTTLVDAAAAGLWLDNDTNNAPADPQTLLAGGCRRLHGLPPAAAASTARALLAGDAYSFAGYARWEINQRWDVIARRESPRPHERAARHFHRLATHAGHPPSPLPPPLRPTAAFQAYIAERDAFVRRSGLDVFQARRLHARATPAAARRLAALLSKLLSACDVFSRQLRAARAAARAMWDATRDPQRCAQSQNLTLLDQDARRLSAWRRWLRSSLRDPARVRTACPMCGAWQLQFTVHNFAPALQKIIVEQQQPDGAWIELHSRFTIEFRAAAARPRAKIAREFATPVPPPPPPSSHGDAAPTLPLRIALRGLGQVRLGNIHLTDGVTTHRATPSRFRPLLGQPAPAEGWPVLDWQHNADTLPLTF
ncbi:family 20 glycosylhydrolase [Geminisphaera colitermitum]|uniref:family 20 glycosylhydrolase n=1 Tax=Geminisphaera colitermitum TaxID=1148786 RepID=UPI0005BAB89B|nr:family 20 glycosylhydrolase [Geminisphaera colitermitum]